MQPGPGGHPRHAQGAKVNREWLDRAADRTQILRRSNKALSPAIAGGDGVVRLEPLGARLDDLAYGAALQGLAQLKRWHVRFPGVHSTAHVRVHRHVEISDEHLLISNWLQFGACQGEVRCGWNPDGAGGQPNFATWGSRHKRNVVWSNLGFKPASPINRNEDSEEGGAGHFGGQWNLVLWNYDRLAGGDRDTGGDGGGPSRFHGRNSMSSSVRLRWG